MVQLGHVLPCAHGEATEENGVRESKTIFYGKILVQVKNLTDPREKGL